MKQIKKLFAGVIALCMLFTFMPAVMAEDTVTYSLQGDATIFAPPVGRKTEVPYELLADGAAVSGAELSLSESRPAGVSLNADKTAVVLDGTTIKSGSFTVTATKGDVTEEKPVTVSADRFYEDFNAQTDTTQKADAYIKNIDTGVVGNKFLNGSAALLGAEENGNKYAASSSSIFQIYPDYYTTGWQKTKLLTAEFDVIGTGTGNILKENRANMFNVTTTDGVLYVNGNDTGYTFASGWTKIAVVLDYYEFDITVNIGANSFGPYPMSAQTLAFARELTFTHSIDNLALYSGTGLIPKPGTISGTDKIFAPHKEQKSKISYNFTFNNETISGAKWSLLDEPVGVTINSSGTLIIDGAKVKPGTFIVKAESDTAIAEKSVTIYDVCYLIDFENIDFGDALTVSAKNQKFYIKKLSDGSFIQQNLNNNNSDARSTDVIAIEASNSNKYYSIGNTYPAYCMLKPQWAHENVWINNKKITVEVDVKNPNNATILKDNADGKFSITSVRNKLVVNGEETNFSFDSNDWTKLQIAFDYEAKTINIWADGNKIKTDVAMAPQNTYLNQVQFPCNVDNIAFYSGEPVNPEGVYVDGSVYTDGAAIASGSHNINVALGVSTDAKSTRSLVAAHYVDGTLNKIDFVSKEINDSSLMRAALNNVSGGEVRIFLWDDALVPIEITSIPTTIN